LASAVNLRAGDVPELEPRPYPRNLQVGSGPLDGCDARQRGIIRVSSRSFRSHTNLRREGGAVGLTHPAEAAPVRPALVHLFPVESASSVVFLMSNERQALSELSRWRTREARVCLRRGEEAEGFITQVEVSRLSSPLSGLPIRGLRRAGHFWIAPHGSRGVINFYSDQFGFVIGRVLVTLDTYGAPNPVRVATERRLLSLLYSRAKAYKV
jgi:hypothetical protein